MEAFRTLFNKKHRARSMRTLPYGVTTGGQFTTRHRRRKTVFCGFSFNTEMKKQVIYGYLGLCILTAVSFVNYYLIQNQDDTGFKQESTALKGRRQRHTRDITPSKYSLDAPDQVGLDSLGYAPEPIQEPDASNSKSEHGEPVKNIYYVKVHKAGSTTLQNIIFRFAMKHRLRVAIFNRQWGMPYPDYAKPEFLYENINDPRFQKYNMICDHSVYDRATVAPYMEDGYESIAILREPYSHLVSAFDFWNLAKRFRLHKARDPLRQFLTKDPNQYKDITPHFNRTKNMQAFHFGHVDYHDNSKESIDRLIDHVDKHFKLVMLRERFEESLILMRRMFHWQFEDILYMDQFVNTQPKARTRTDREDEHLRAKHREFATADYRLYEHFSDKLNRMIENQPNDLLGEVLYFKETNRKVAEFCENVCALFPIDSIKNLTVADVIPRLKQGIVFPANKWHGEVHLTYEKCAYMKFWTYQYHNAFRVQQLPASCAESGDASPAVAKTIFDAHDIEKYGYCDKKNHVLFNFPLDVFKEIVLDVPMHPVNNAKIAKSPKCRARET